MAKDRVIDITGEIGQWGFSMNYVKYMMNELGEGPVIVKVTSLGGDVNHALKIKNIFQEHGDVTVEYIGFNASAATIIGHGAAKTTIHEDSLYLIHKPSNWVDEWGYMNEDEIQQAITDLQAQKKNTEACTLIIANDYVNCRGMKINDVMELMKASSWLTAKEAVKLGLVDELIPSNKKAVITNQTKAIMSANGYPIPVIDKEQEKNPVMDAITKGFQDIKNSLNLNKSTQMNKDYSFINQVLNVEGVEVKDEKVTLTVNQILALNNKIKENEDAAAVATQAKETAETAQKKAEDSLTDVLTKLDAIDPTIKSATEPDSKIAAIQAKLSGRPRTKPETPQGSASQVDEKKDGADWDTINKLPHNQVLDEGNGNFV